jgi:hypothetical protein
MAEQPHAEWHSLYDKLSITAASLATHPDDADLKRLATWLGSALADWEGIEQARFALHKRALETAGHVRVADALLDHALGVFAEAVLAHVENDPTHALYVRFFPEPHEDIIDLGLDHELPVAAHIVMALEQDEALPSSMREHKVAIGAAVALGNRALTARADALADLGRHQARVEGWIESAGCMHQSVARALVRLAEKRKLSDRWAQAFV